VFPLKDNIPARRFPFLTVAIIVANVLVFFLLEEARPSLGGTELDEGRIVDFGAIPYEIAHPGTDCAPEGSGPPANQATERPGVGCGVINGSAAEPGDGSPPMVVTLFSSMFMHGGVLHLAGNMLFLWIFGNNVEDSMGRLRYLVFYLGGGLVALAAQTIVDPESTVPTIGASGAVAAALGGYALLYPRARIITFVIIVFFVTFVELPALLVLGLWLLLQVLYGAAELAQPVGEDGGVAYFAHIGGFVFGLALIRLFANRPRDDYAEEGRLPVH
jgi:membrane associated rhomboid family serine protease